MPLTSDEELAEPLRLCDASLRSVGSDLIADGRLTDVLRRVVAFGLTLVRLDVRQESARHTEAVDAIARHKGLGNYAEWNEERRVDFLLNILSQERVLGTEGLRPEPTVADVLATFRTIAEMPRDSLGAYVITQAGRASDVLAVELLQREAGISRPLQGRAAVRDGPRPARRGGRDERAAVDSLVPRPGHARRGTSGSHGRLLRFRKGHRAARRRMGALQGAGVDRRGVSRSRRAHHAVPRPRRNRRPRRRPDPSGDPVAAAGLGRRHAARHRTGRDDSGQVRPARYRPPHARGLHDGDAGGHAQRAAAGQQRMARDDEPRRRGRARRFPPHRLRRSALPAIFQRRHARGASSMRCTSAAVRHGASRRAACRPFAPFPGSSPGRRHGCCSRPGSASTKCSAKACPPATATSAARCTGSGRSSARRST